MNKLDEFKEFVRGNEGIYEMVKDNKYTWQQLYEAYDLYGEKAKIFQNDSRHNTNRNVFNDLISATKNIDMNKVNEGLDSLKKVADIFSEFTSSKVENSNVDLTRKRRYRRFDQ